MIHTFDQLKQLLTQVKHKKLLALTSPHHVKLTDPSSGPKPLVKDLLWTL